MDKIITVSAVQPTDSNFIGFIVFFECKDLLPASYRSHLHNLIPFIYQNDGRMVFVYCASRSAACNPQAVRGHFGNPALASR